MSTQQKLIDNQTALIRGILHRNNCCGLNVERALIQISHHVLFGTDITHKHTTNGCIVAYDELLLISDLVKRKDRAGLYIKLPVLKISHQVDNHFFKAVEFNAERDRITAMKDLEGIEHKPHECWETDLQIIKRFIVDFESAPSTGYNDEDEDADILHSHPYAHITYTTNGEAADEDDQMTFVEDAMLCAVKDGHNYNQLISDLESIGLMDLHIASRSVNSPIWDESSFV